MRNSFSILLFTLLLAGLPACIYTDSTLYFAEPIPGDPPLISVSTNLDSLLNPPVNDSLELVYQVEISGGDFYYLYADVGSSTVYESDSDSGSFWITPDLVTSPGIDSVYMEYYYSSNSNSLADKLGYEVLVKYLNIAIDFNLEDGL